MSPENFCFWLNGYLEISNAKSLGEKETQEIRNHLKLVFTKLTPNLNEIFPPTYTPSPSTGPMPDCSPKIYC